MRLNSAMFKCSVQDINIPRERRKLANRDVLQASPGNASLLSQRLSQS